MSGGEPAGSLLSTGAERQAGCHGYQGQHLATGEKSGAVSVICTRSILHSGFSGAFSTRDPTWGNHPHEPSHTCLDTARKQKAKAFNFTFYGPHKCALGLTFQGGEE